VTTEEARRRWGASKADLVHQQLKDEIELGELAPGRRLSGSGWSSAPGPRGTPVRRPLRRLAAEGWWTWYPARGARVSRVSAAGIRDLFQFRELLEPAAVRQATEAAAADPAAAPGLRRAARRVRPIHAARPPTRGHGLLQLADRFDWAVVGATRNEHLRRTITELRPHTARLRNLSHLDPQRVEVSVEEHLAVCDALLAGDADGAGRRPRRPPGCGAWRRSSATWPGRPARASTCSAERGPPTPLQGPIREPGTRWNGHPSGPHAEPARRGGRWSF
jgi:DNA-binding GntR family transcriptional regulator